MFYNLVNKEHTFQKPQQSKLLLAVPLCARTIIFFCDNLMFYHYSLRDDKILYQSKLPGRPIQAIPYSGHQIIFNIIQTKTLMLLDIRSKTLQEITKLPMTKLHIQSREKNLLTQIHLTNFQYSGNFLIEQPIIQQQKIYLYFHKKCKILSEDQPQKFHSFNSISYSTKKKIIKKFDNHHRLVFFNQEIQDNGCFRFSIISCQKNYKQKQIHLQNNAFTRFAIIRQIINISQDQGEQKFLIFVNSSEPTILLVAENQVLNYSYQPNKIAISSVLINVKLGYGIFSYLPDIQQKDTKVTHVLQLVEFKTGKLQQKKKCKNNYEIQKSWEDDYLFQYRKQITPNSKSIFQSSHIIDKRTIYMKMLWDKGFQDLSEVFMEQIMNHF